MHFYERQASDPAWLIRAAEFHGHLGPWLIVGAMVGNDAVTRLDTHGHWLIDVTCSMPTDRHRPPFTCVLDGLQASSGATMGKCNLHLVWQPERYGYDWPAVAVVRSADRGLPAAGVLYKPLPALRKILDGLTPDRLEPLSRELAGRKVADLFQVEPVDGSDATTKASH